MDNNADKTRAVTQDDVARYAGVARSMVSYVLNGSDRPVAPKTRERILKAIEELGYRPNKFARGLLRQKSDASAVKQIGIILVNAEVFLRPYYAEILAGIHEEAHENKYHIRFIRFFNELKNPALLNELIHHEEVCGLILLSLDQILATEEDKKLLETIKKRIPNTVCLEWQYPGLSSVSFDRQDAAATATRYLLEKGYAEIAYIGEEDNRIIGFKQAFLERNRDIFPLRISFADDIRKGFKAVQEIYRSGALPGAILAGSDEVAIGILRFLNMNRIEVPGCVALASIDNIEMAEFTNPPLTTVHVQKSNMGRQAIRLVMQQANNKDYDVIHISLPTELILRSSS